jgi:hypothetical protein
MILIRVVRSIVIIIYYTFVTKLINITHEMAAVLCTFEREC